MENENDGKPQNKKIRLPIIALIFGLAPAIFLFSSWIPFLGIAFMYLFFATWWGIYFQIVGLILGIIALCNRKKRIGIIGLIFSIIAILSPFIWCCILYYLDNYTSVEIWL